MEVRRSPVIGLRTGTDMMAAFIFLGSCGGAETATEVPATTG